MELPFIFNDNIVVLLACLTKYCHFLVCVKSEKLQGAIYRIEQHLREWTNSNIPIPPASLVYLKHQIYYIIIIIIMFS